MAVKKPGDGRPMHEQIAHHLRTQIEAGVLRDREMLASSRRLADDWGVSVFTAHQAVQTLVAEGLVVSTPRSGSVVRRPEKERVEGLITKSPQMVLVGGFAGCGKTEFGRILARSTKWPILDKDTTTRPILEAALEVSGLRTYDRESPFYMDTLRPREYEALIATANENLSCGISAIVTAPFLKEFTNTAWISKIAAHSESLGAVMQLVWIDCDQESRRTYLRHRGAARDTAKLADWDAHVAQINTEMRPAAPYFLVKNHASADPLKTQALVLVKELAEQDSA